MEKLLSTAEREYTAFRGALEALEDRVENRRPEFGAPLQGARRPDPGVAGGGRVLRKRPGRTAAPPGSAIPGGLALKRGDTAGVMFARAPTRSYPPTCTN